MEAEALPQEPAPQCNRYGCSRCPRRWEGIADIEASAGERCTDGDRHEIYLLPRKGA